MTSEEFLVFEKHRKDMPKHSSGGFKFKVIECRESVRKFGAQDTKRKMVGKIYDWANKTSTEGGRIYLLCSISEFNPSFYYTEVELVEINIPKLTIPVEPQKLDYNHVGYAKIFDK